MTTVSGITNKTETIKAKLSVAQARLNELDLERETLLLEIEALQQELKVFSSEQKDELSSPATIHNSSPPEVKITLFRSLFRGREDVYPKRWDNMKTGRSGYAPACKNEWERHLCHKPEVKCGECPNKAYFPVTDEVIYQHLTGKITIGVYPLRSDETCHFLAVDFDKTTWLEDAGAFLDTCRMVGIPAALERSRSGNGGHVWIFFTEPVPSVIARKLGAYLITETLESRPEIGLDSYDRFFPSQDTMPQGGFGNLIALPLQKKPRDQGNSLFLNEVFKPYEDQWTYLSSIKKMTLSQVNSIVEKAIFEGKIIGVPLFPEEENSDQPWNCSPALQKTKAFPIQGPFPGQIDIVISNQIYVPKDGLSPSLQNRLIQTAAFQNPEFYKAQSMRFPTYDQPRVISCAESFSKYIGLPRGCQDEVVQLLSSLAIKINVIDERNQGVSINTTFRGTLRLEQQAAAEALLAEDIGVLAATTAFGKTVVASYLIAKRARNTLIILHRQQLLEQWIARLSTFLDINPDDIGQIGAGKHRPTGIIDIALMQSLVKDKMVDEIVTKYGYLIVDECHHISASSFEQVARQCKARYVTGLSATAVRKDGRHPIIFMQCGPPRYRVDARKQALLMPFTHRVIQRETGFKLPGSLVMEQKPSIQDIYTKLIADEKRNDLIFDDVLKALEMKRSPLLITERKEHLAYFEERLSGFAKNVIVLRGGMGAKQRHEITAKLAAIPDEAERIILATGRYLGEGFDDARLDTLFLTMPISWEGTLAQYAGRLHREHDSKSEVIIYDYVDSEVSMLMKMWRKRIKGYQAIGYEIQDN